MLIDPQLDLFHRHSDQTSISSLALLRVIKAYRNLFLINCKTVAA